MYIDYNSEKIFEEYKNKGFDEIYFDNKFNFIKGIKEKNENENKNNIININDISDSSDFVNDSFYEYHKKEQDELKQKEEDNDICEIIDDSEEEIKENVENNNENVIELDETISLNSNSSNEEDKGDNNLNNKNINNLQLNNKIYKSPKKINCLEKNKLIDLKLEMNFNSIKEKIKNEFLQRKRNLGNDVLKMNDELKNKDGEEVIDLISLSDFHESSNFIPIDNEFAQQFSTNSN